MFTEKLLRTLIVELLSTTNFAKKDATTLFFTYDNGKLVLSDNNDESIGKIDTTLRVVEFLKSNISVINDPTNFKKMLRDLIRSGNIEQNWTIKGLDKVFGKTVQSCLLTLNSLISTSTLNTNDITYAYHGTSAMRAKIILREGLIPGKFDFVYDNLIPNYSDKMVYLTPDPTTAEFYAKRQKSYDNDVGFVILKVEIPDKNKLFASETGLIHVVKQASDIENATPNSSLKRASEVAYKGRIPASFIKIYKSIPNWKKIVELDKAKRGDRRTDFILMIRTGEISNHWTGSSMNDLYDNGIRGSGYCINIEGTILGRQIKRIKVHGLFDDTNVDDICSKVENKLITNSFFKKEQIQNIIDIICAKIRDVDFTKQTNISHTFSDGKIFVSKKDYL